MHQHVLKVAVVGHVEWVLFGRLPAVPRAGQVATATDPFEEPAGGGAVAAVQLARLAGKTMLFTALGDDELGRRSAERLRSLGVQVHAAVRRQPTRRAVAVVDDAGQRTITTFGPRLAPARSDAELPWDELRSMDAVYFTAGDPGALQAARSARVLIATPRAREALGHGVPLDALVLSRDDRSERASAGDHRQEAKLTVWTEGSHGGSYRQSGGPTGRWSALPTEVVDAYGCGDSFAAGLTYGLGGDLPAAAALQLGAACGAACLAGRGPYERQLRGEELAERLPGDHPWSRRRTFGEAVANPTSRSPMLRRG